jgi:hypothetical protein
MKRNPQSRRRNVVRRYGISPEAYSQLLTIQGGICAICRRPPQASEYLHVDHDHRCCQGQRSCGQCVRGLLCSRCNSAIAFFCDDVALLQAAVLYLQFQTMRRSA